jgi:protein-S-isoprenylcysteine O-methyltransferase Ste14
MSGASLLSHLRDILILPVTVTCVVPYLFYNPGQGFIPENAWLQIAGIIILLAGSSLFLYTVYLFRKIGRGTLAPWSVKQKLVVYGPYRYCRNPMITGVLCVLIGESLIFHSSAILVWAFTFFIINTLYFLLSEEPGLEERFGEDYREYKRQVPRWIPRITPYKIR